MYIDSAEIAQSIYIADILFGGLGSPTGRASD